MMNTLKKILIMTILGSLLGCASTKPNIPTVQQVDINRFMGAWYVIAAIPTAIEKESFNGIETYKLNDDGTIDTTFTFNKGSLSGPLKTYNPKGFIVEGTGNAVWGMQFIWPIKAEYLIAYLDDAYTQTIIARNARDYVWIMAKTPHLSDEEYATLTKKVSDMGYDISQLRKVPHNQLVK
jgi:apolipoprotein D and lipocalin family protein